MDPLLSLALVSWCALALSSSAPLAAAPLQTPPPPPVSGSDSCTTPDVIVGTGYFAFDNSTATTGVEGQSEPLCVQSGGSTAMPLDVWFTWTATVTGTGRVSTCFVAPPYIHPKIAAYDGAGCPVSAALVCNFLDAVCSSTGSTIVFPCVLGNAYTIQIGLLGATVGASVFEFTASGVPTNDDCATPIALVGAGPFPFDNSLATSSPVVQPYSFCIVRRDLWYTWTAPTSGQYAVQTMGLTQSDTKIGVYAGAGCPVTSPIACNDNSAFAYYSQSHARFFTTAGSVYTFALGSSPAATVGGHGEFSVVPVAAPANDDCSAPIMIQGAGPHLFDNTFATTSPQGQNNFLCWTNDGIGVPMDVWFTWIPHASGTAVLTTCNLTTTDTKLAVYSGGGCPTSAAIDCSDDDCFFQSRVTFPVSCTQSYAIQIGLYAGLTCCGGGQGRFRIDVMGGTDCPSAFCSGDGSATPCPCANSGGPESGCANSATATGARLAWSGVANVSNDTFVIAGSGMPDQPCLYLQGTAKYNGGSGTAFGDGLRCVGGTVVRLGLELNAIGASQYPSAGRAPISVRGLIPASGGTRYYQCWYRDTADYCIANATFNLTNGLTVRWVP